MATGKDKTAKGAGGGKGSPAGSVMVVGGGIAGVQAALDLANSGFFVYRSEEHTSELQSR